MNAESAANMVLGAFETNDIGFAWWTYRLNNDNALTHGIYYLDDTGTQWLFKETWFELVGSYLD